MVEFGAPEWVDQWSEWGTGVICIFSHARHFPSLALKRLRCSPPPQFANPKLSHNHTHLCISHSFHTNSSINLPSSGLSAAERLTVSPHGPSKLRTVFSGKQSWALPVNEDTLPQDFAAQSPVFQKSCSPFCCVQWITWTLSNPISYFL